MDLLKKELERKKKAVELAKQQSSQSSSSNKFLNAAELRKLQEEQEERLHEEAKRSYNEKLEDSHIKRPRLTNGDKDENATSNKKRRHQPDDAKPSATTQREAATTTTTSDNVNKDDGSLKDLSAEQVTEQLRAYGLAVRLFGEDEDTRRDRLRVAKSQHENAQYNERDEFQLGGGHGIRNPFLERKTKQRQDDQVLPESVAKAPSSGGIPDQKKEKKPKDAEDDEADPHKEIYHFLKDLLKQWEEDLALRPEAVKRTMAGKNETKILKQCKDYIRPLFKLCKTRKLEEGMTIHLTNIVQYCQEGEFVKANDAYMDVAIGRAAWPIGVTMVGIHARSGRERIGSSNVAHVMNSELQRKYLTSVKRLITYCQKKRSDVAPSKKVMN